MMNRGTFVLFLVIIWKACIAFAGGQYGTEFFLAKTLKNGNNKCLNTTITIASEKPGRAIVYASFGGFNKTLQINSGVTSFDIPCPKNFSRSTFDIPLFLVYGDGGVHIQTDVDVAVYATSFYRSTHATYLVLPAYMLGTKYITAVFNPKSSAANFVAALAVYDNTIIAFNIEHRSEHYSVNLNKLQSYEVIYSGLLEKVIVTGNKPFAVFIGTAHSTNMLDCEIVLQLLPDNMWSTTYIVPPIPQEPSHKIQPLFVETDHSTVCMTNGNASQTCSIITQSADYYGKTFLQDHVVVTANNTFSIVQHGGDHSGASIDPFITLVQGIDQFLYEYIFAVPETYKTGFINYIAITVPTINKDKMLLDGQLVVSNQTFNIKTPVGNFTILTSTLSTGFHVLTNPCTKFGVMLYGYNGNSSYGYPAGIGIPDLKLTLFMDTLNQSRTSTHVIVHVKDKMELRCAVNLCDPVISYSWQKKNSCLSQVAGVQGAVYNVPSVSIADSGTFVCTASSGSSFGTEEFRIDVVGNSTIINSCAFDDFSLCGWKQLSTDDLDWTFQNGPTQSDDTGPDNDHTLGNDHGYYLFIESSAPSVYGNTAKLLSPDLPADDDACISLWYFMYGDGIGTLKISAKDSCNNQTTELFSATGDKGQQWLKLEVDVPKVSAPNVYTIIIEATVGPTYHGDIAIDDVDIISKRCTRKDPEVIG